MILKLTDLISEFNLDINSILHVGAHKCEELDKYHSISISNNNIIWIEAIPELVKYIKEKDNTIRIYNYLVTDVDDETYSFNISNNGQSSSIYELGTHKKHHPEVKYIGCKELRSKRLDSIFKIENIDLKIDFINLDIQGSELLALKSLGKILNDVKYIYTEINTEHVYKDCCLINEIDEYLKKYNFKRVKTGYLNEKWGWGDAFYIKE
jgi:FkbM family methyltransferase